MSLEVFRTLSVKRLSRVDGMVLHCVVRTMFGNRVRNAAKVWCSVAGHGRDGILLGMYRYVGLLGGS